MMENAAVNVVGGTQIHDDNQKSEKNQKLTRNQPKINKRYL